MAKTNPLQFAQQVRAETAKVVWPSQRETLLTSVMVFILSFLAAIFFYTVDWFIRWGLEAFLNAAS